MSNGKSRQVALFLEAVPLISALIGVSALIGLGALADLDWAVPLPLELLLSLPLTIVIQAGSMLFLGFFLSGVGWMYSGRTLVGMVVLLVHGYVSLGIVNFSHSTGGSPPEALAYFSASVAMAALSVLGLALATRSFVGKAPEVGPPPGAL